MYKIFCPCFLVVCVNIAHRCAQCHDVSSIIQYLPLYIYIQVISTYLDDILIYLHNIYFDVFSMLYVCADVCGMASSDHRLYGYCLHGRHGVLHFDDFWPRSHAHLVGFSSSGVTKGAEHFGESRISWPGVECVTDRIRTYHKIFQRYKAWKLNIKLLQSWCMLSPCAVLFRFFIISTTVLWYSGMSTTADGWAHVSIYYISPKLTRADSTPCAVQCTELLNAVDGVLGLSNWLRFMTAWYAAAWRRKWLKSYQAEI